jgi:hypothetical protein
MPADDFTSCKTKDDPNYDYFVCQFFDSLTRYQTTDPKGYWFGRLISYDFSCDNLVETGSLAEDPLREDLENSDTIFHGYTLLEVNYQQELARLNTSAVQVTGKVELDLTINEERQTITKDFSFSIKQCWQSTGVVFT